MIYLNCISYPWNLFDSNENELMQTLLWKLKLMQQDIIILHYKSKTIGIIIGLDRSSNLCKLINWPNSNPVSMRFEEHNQ